MSNETRVVIVPPGPPEALAFALARYSRSADSIEKSLEWVFSHSQEKFWETFYFKYNHASIADLGHATVCFEGISELATQYLLDEQLWDGQAKSSRYQDFSLSGYYRPKDAGEEYDVIIDRMMTFYTSFTEKVVAQLKKKNPKPDTMKQGDYDRNIQARAFDISRYVLPLATNTSLGQVVSIRTLEAQANRLLGSDIEELRELGAKIQAACAEAPSIEIEDSSRLLNDEQPLAPTLARHIKPDTFTNNWLNKIVEFIKEHDLGQGRLNTLVKSLLNLSQRTSAEYVSLWTKQNKDSNLLDHVVGSPEEEIVATTLFSVFENCGMFDAVTLSREIEKRGLTSKFIEMLLEDRGPHDHLPREFRVGQEFIFEIQCDIGAFRDMHRHRRCQQIWSRFTPHLGWSTPDPLYKVDFEDLWAEYREFMTTLFADIKQRPRNEQQYLLPMATLTKALFKMDFAEVEYIAKLRSGVKGHFSYRKIACEMKRIMDERFPALGKLMKVTPLAEEDLLIR